jgi:hypothetical protein
VLDAPDVVPEVVAANLNEEMGARSRNNMLVAELL